MVPAMDAWRGEDLMELAAALATRPGHEAVRTQITQILRHVFRADYLALDHEVRMPEVRGRADMLFGATVFEFKSDLRREMDDVRARLPDYLRERERKTGRRYLGIAERSQRTRPDEHLRMETRMTWFETTAEIEVAITFAIWHRVHSCRATVLR